MYLEKMFIVSLRFDWWLIICTSGNFPGILLHVGRTSSGKSAINTILGGMQRREYLEMHYISRCTISRDALSCREDALNWLCMYWNGRLSALKDNLDMCAYMQTRQYVYRRLYVCMRVTDILHACNRHITAFVGIHVRDLWWHTHGCV